MCNLLINTNDRTFRYGIAFLINQMFNTIKKNNALTIYDSTQVTIECADVIVMDILAGEYMLCQPELKKRKNNSIILGFYEGTKNIYSMELPLCLNNAVFISKSTPVHTVREIILHAWNVPHNEKLSLSRNCLECKHKTLSPQQMKFASLFRRGDRMEKIAKEMNITIKTAHAHKNIIKNKYHLKNEFELLNFLKVLKLTNEIPDAACADNHSLFYTP